MHHGLIKTSRGIAEEARFPKASIVEEARGLRPDDRTRPRDLVMVHFAEKGRHLVMDGVVTIVYKNFVLSMVAAIPGLRPNKVKT